MRQHHPAAGPSQTTLSSLQGGRALAALAVVLFHASIFYIPRRLYPDAAISPMFNIGYAGVEFFFVLSGFIMMLVHGRDFGRPDRAARFVGKRVARILPFYWVVLTGLLAAEYLLLGTGPDGGRSVSNVFHSYLLVPDPSGRALVIPVAWTLSFEMLFYALFCLLILNLPIGRIVLACWFGGSIAVAFLPDPPYPLGFLFSYYNLLFPIGIAAAWSHQRLPIGGAVPLAVVGMVAFALVGLLDVYGSWPLGEALRTVAFGSAAGMIVAGLAAAERHGLLAAPKWLAGLGDASYAIYIVHTPALAFATMVFLRLGIERTLPPIACLGLLFALAAGAGVAAHVLVERPLLGLFRRRRTEAVAEAV